MDRKISIRLREWEYEKLAKYAEESKKSISDLVRSRALMEPQQGNVVGTNEMKIQMLNIKKHISNLSASCPNLNFQPIEYAMEVMWDELY